jgi:hypothetical protein
VPNERGARGAGRLRDRQFRCAVTVARRSQNPGVDNRATTSGGTFMRIQRLAFAACVVVASLVTSGCAVNRANANVDPGANLAAIKRVHVIHVAEDDRRIDELIAQRMTQLGFIATTGDTKRKDVDANMTYIDRWMWDITMYMLELTIVVRDPATDFPLATGNSFHTSLTRLSPKEMVDEVTGNIFKAVKK